jgi:hypothetical protein
MKRRRAIGQLGDNCIQKDMHTHVRFNRGLSLARSLAMCRQADTHPRARTPNIVRTALEDSHTPRMIVHGE